MKIYCSRYKTDEEIFDSIVDKPIWIKAYTDNYKEYPYFVRILSDSDAYYKMIIVNDYWVENPHSKTIDTSEIMNIGLQWKNRWSVYRPVEMYTADEFLELINNEQEE
jgi:hypothetical protein